VRGRIAEGFVTASSTSLAVAIVVVGILSYLDVLTGYEIRLGLLYLIPVALATWRAGPAAGLLLSLLSAAGMHVADRFGTLDTEFPSHILIPYWNTAIQLGYFVVVTTILAALKRALDRERRNAREDALTGIANRRGFINVARAEIERSGRFRRPISIAYVDCDDFKNVNDRFGHGTGDHVLKLVATTLTERLRQCDVVARMGGDEFVILMPETSPAEAEERIQSLKAVLAERTTAGGWPVTLSVGVCTFLTPPDTLEQALKLSDELLCLAKQRGKDAMNHRIFGGPGREKDAQTLPV
jgi:diguanylate cyclase (GGDEF)-like protein